MGRKPSDRIRKYKERKDIKWTQAINHWIMERCPLREHGYTSRQQLLDELNQAFGTSFSIQAFCTHVYDSGIQLGLAHSNSTIARGTAHWRHRTVGSFQTKKGYIRIKVAEPNVWMQYQRYIWEQQHPGESAAGKTVIFLDGDNRNFNPDNLECITRKEMAVMNELGNRAGLSRDERVAILTMARIKLAKSDLLGSKDAQRLRNKMRYDAIKNSPEFKERRHQNYLRRKERMKSDDALREKYNQKQRERRTKKCQEKMFSIG